MTNIWNKAYSFLTNSDTTNGNTESCNIQTFFLPQKRFINTGDVSLFANAPSPYVSCPSTFQLSSDGSSIQILKSGVLTINLTAQCRADTGTTVLKPVFGLNGNPISNGQSKLIWPAFVTGYFNLFSLSIAIQVQAQDVIQLGMQLEQTSQQHGGSILVGGPSSFLVLTLTSVQ